MLARASLHPTNVLAGQAGWLALGMAAGAVLGLLALSLACEPRLGLAFAALALVVALVSRHLFASLVVILATIVVFGSESLFNIDVGFRLVEVDALLLLGMFGVGVRALQAPSEVRFRSLDVVMLVFVWVMAVMTVTGFLGSAPGDNIRSELRPLGYLIGSYLVGRQSLSRVREVRVLQAVLLAATTIAALKVLYVYLTVPLLVPGSTEPGTTYFATRVMNSDGFKRVIGAGGEIFPVVAGVGVLAYLGAARTRATQIGLSLIFVLLMTVNVISYTRSYWIGLLTGFVMYLVARPTRSMRWLWIAIGIGGVAAAAVIGFVATTQGPDALDLLAERFAVWRQLASDRSIHSRLSEGQAILTAVRESPILGRGLGSEYTFFSESEGASYRTWEYTHNSFLYFLLKGGALGLLAFLALLAAAFRLAWRLHRLEIGSELRLMAFTFSATLAILVVVSMSSPWLTHYVGAALAGTSMAALAFLARRAEEEQEEEVQEKKLQEADAPSAAAAGGGEAGRIVSLESQRSRAAPGREIQP